ncbi:Bicarbonate transport ATP-binding protein CmpC [Alcanivorax sp. ALC70]|nr:Bicarbonate transport ATP-binding protein CmpC [Alcanivorax sp. ALC70]
MTPNIMLVDDQPPRAALLERALEDLGHGVQARLTSAAGLAGKVRAGAPALVLVDMDAPDRDALESLALDGDDALPRPLPLFCDDEALVVAALRAGVSAYVAGGSDPAWVREVVAVATARYREYRALREELEGGVADPAAQAQIDAARRLLMRRRRFNEPAADAALRRQALNTGQPLIQVARSLLAFADLLKARGDHDRHRRAHRLYAAHRQPAPGGGPGSRVLRRGGPGRDPAAGMELGQPARPAAGGRGGGGANAGPLAAGHLPGAGRSAPVPGHRVFHGLNGNGITVSPLLFHGLRALAEGPTPQDMALALNRLVAARAAAGDAPLVLAVVFPYSCHAYQLRHWLAVAGLDPDRDVRLVVLPPSQMVDHLRLGHIDGFCVGEPWNSLAAHTGAGHCLLSGYQVWENAPEKVLAVTRDWAEAHPETHRALLRALHRAAEHADRHLLDCLDLLAHPAWLDLPAEVLRAPFTQRLPGAWWGSRSRPITSMCSPASRPTFPGVPTPPSCLARWPAGGRARPATGRPWPPSATGRTGSAPPWTGSPACRRWTPSRSRATPLPGSCRAPPGRWSWARTAACPIRIRNSWCPARAAPGRRGETPHRPP